MKKTLKLLFVLLFVQQLHAQTPQDVIDSLNSQLRHLFENLQPPQSPDTTADFLYDMAIHATQESYWSDYNQLQVMDNITFWAIYDELKTCAYDTGRLAPPIPIIEHYIQTYDEDTTALAFLDINFHKLLPGVLDTFYYFNFDTINNTLTDNVNRTLSPYQTKTIFTFSPFVQEFYFPDITFKIDPSLFFTDSFNLANQNRGVFKVDFGDGVGWRIINPNTTQYLNIHYADSGIYTLKLAWFTSPTSIEKFAETRIHVQSNTDIKMPEYTVEIDNELTAGFYPACNGYEGPEKIIIYMTGFRPIENLGRKVSKVYEDKIEGNELRQLENHGYSFYVLSFKHTHNGVINNAMLLVKLIDYIKGAHPNAEPYIIMGSSMGGLVTRYALTYMETNAYLQRESSVAPEKMHNTRLWVSIDAPHQGFNIPAALQHYINNYSNTWPHNPYLDAFNRLIKKGLNSQSAMEMMVHHNSAMGTTQLNHSAHADVLNLNLYALNPQTNGYPMYCKKMAISQGMGTGQNQEGVNRALVQPSDTLFFIKNTITSAVLGNSLALANEELTLRFASSGYSNLYSHKATMDFKTLKITFIQKSFLFVTYWVPKIYFVTNTINTTLGSLSRTGTNIDYIAGGNYSFVDKVEAYDDGGFTGFFVSNKNMHHSTVKWPLSINFPTGWAGSVSISSDAWGFNTCAVASALDYDDGFNTSNPDFRGMNVGTIMSRTPFDIIVAEPEGSKHFTHGKYTNHTLDGTPWHHLQSNNDTCRYLNREIGEDILFLNNYTTPPGVDLQFSATYDIVLGQDDNWTYNYPNQSQNLYLRHKIFQTNSNFANETIFSKSNPFTLNTNSTAKFIAGNGITQHTWTNLGHWDEIQVQFLPCNPDYGTANKGGATALAGITTEQAIQVYPNPSQSGYLTVTNPNQEPIEFHISDATGRRIYTNQFNTSSFTTENLPLSNGIYFVTINKANGQTQTLKIIVQH